MEKVADESEIALKHVIAYVGILLSFWRIFNWRAQILSNEIPYNESPLSTNRMRQKRSPVISPDNVEKRVINSIRPISREKNPVGKRPYSPDQSLSAHTQRIEFPTNREKDTSMISVDSRPNEQTGAFSLDFGEVYSRLDESLIKKTHERKSSRLYLGSTRSLLENPSRDSKKIEIRSSESFERERSIKDTKISLKLCIRLNEDDKIQLFGVQKIEFQLRANGFKDNFVYLDYSGEFVGNFVVNGKERVNDSIPWENNRILLKNLIDGKNIVELTFYNLLDKKLNAFSSSSILEFTESQNELFPIFLQSSIKFTIALTCYYSESLELIYHTRSKKKVGSSERKRVLSLFEKKFDEFEFHEQSITSIYSTLRDSSCLDFALYINSKFGDLDFKKDDSNLLLYGKELALERIIRKGTVIESIDQDTLDLFRSYVRECLESYEKYFSGRETERYPFDYLTNDVLIIIDKFNGDEVKVKRNLIFVDSTFLESFESKGVSIPVRDNGRLTNILNALFDIGYGLAQHYFGGIVSPSR